MKQTQSRMVNCETCRPVPHYNKPRDVITECLAQPAGMKNKQSMAAVSFCTKKL